MGSTGQLTAVADAGPLIHLHEIGELRLLRLFDALFVTDHVWAEVVVSGRVPEAAVLASANIVRRARPDADHVELIARHNLGNLQSGEISALSLGMAEGISILLTDDLAARDAARALGMTPVGSLGVVVRAHHLGILSLTDAERTLCDLFQLSSLFVTRTIVDLAIEELRNSRQP
jgi:predicted nucleic acid-binding protein